MMLAVLLVVCIVLTPHIYADKLEISRNITNGVTTQQIMQQRFAHLQKNIKRSLLVHVHIPKAGGTALSSALSSNCTCLAERPVVDDVSQPPCKKCRLVHGSKGMRIEYTISRNTGWKFGVHSPYAMMKWGLTESVYNITFYDVIPTYIIMLRNPFDRFLSEATKWSGKKGQAVDWSIRLKKADKILYFKGVNADCFDSNFKASHCRKYLPPANNTDPNPLPPFVKLYASLPYPFIFHNRQTKMIGGSPHDFDMHFDSREQVGTRWRPRKQNEQKILNMAYKVLGMQPDVIVALQERFAESICILEIVYGRLYKFNWVEGIHSHNRDKAFEVESDAPKMTEQVKDIYNTWVKNNQADLLLYAEAQVLFDVQFKEALNVLRLRNVTQRYLETRAPHCMEFMPQ